MNLVKLVFLFISIIIISCSKEVPPAVNLTLAAGECTQYVDEVVETPQSKVVLIEEFSGLSCVNCPTGHAKLEEILTSYSGQVIIMSLHAAGCGGQTDPVIPEQNLVIQAADDILNLYNSGCAGIPAASFDRLIFSGEADILVNGNVATWNSFVAGALSKLPNPPVNLTISKVFDDVTRALDITLRIHYTENVTTDNNFTIALTESNIITAQKLASPPGAIDYEYPQNHVLRSLVTPASGQKVTTEKIPGGTQICSFSVTIDSEWDENEMDIVAFVHEAGDSLNVLQAASIHLK